MQKETKKYSAELLVSNNKVSDFIYAYGESKKIFKVQEGKLFKISFIKNGFNGIIKFKNKVINENYMKDVLFKIGIEKILFQKSFNLSKDISVIPFRSYIIIAIVNTVKNLRRYKSIINKQKREINLRYMSRRLKFYQKKIKEEFLEKQELLILKVLLHN